MDKCAPDMGVLFYLSWNNVDRRKLTLKNNNLNLEKVRFCRSQADCHAPLYLSIFYRVGTTCWLPTKTDEHSKCLTNGNPQPPCNLNVLTCSMPFYSPAKWTICWISQWWTPIFCQQLAILTKTAGNWNSAMSRGWLSHSSLLYAVQLTLSPPQNCQYLGPLAFGDFSSLFWDGETFPHLRLAYNLKVVLNLKSRGRLWPVGPFNRNIWFHQFLN